LIQTIGRAARNVDGKVIMYADGISRAMRAAIDETERRREIQQQYNEENHITPASVRKSIRAVIEATHVAEDEDIYKGRKAAEMTRKELADFVRKLEAEMR